MAKKEYTVTFDTKLWWTDPRIRLPSLAARGLLMELVGCMASSPVVGWLCHEDRTPWTLEEIARGCGATGASDIQAHLDELVKYGAIFHEDGLLTCCDVFKFVPVGERRSIPSELSRWMSKQPCAVCNYVGWNEVDHIIPVSKGGDNERDNLQTLCWACNRAKGNRLDNSGLREIILMRKEDHFLRNLIRERFVGMSEWDRPGPQELRQQNHPVFQEAVNYFNRFCEEVDNA